MKKTLALLILLAAISCSTEDVRYAISPRPDYSEEAYWFTMPCESASQADVFYIAPTCIWDWQDDDGAVHHFMDPLDSSQRELCEGPLRLAGELLGKYCNFYSPYYRQISMDSWMVSEDETQRRFAIAHEDIIAAFRHYMDTINGGRPFFLAGHSQGAKCAIELIKHTLSPEELERMVGAYIFGYPITSDELSEYPTLKPATGEFDTGKVICINSVSHPDACGAMFQDNVVCINPLNWKTDTTYAPAGMNDGTVFFAADGTSDTLFNAIGARLDAKGRSIIIDGLKDDDYYIESIGSLFPKGNYHVYELNLFFLDIQNNLRQRLEHF